MERDLYDGLSQLLTYPSLEYYDKVKRCHDLLRRTHPEVESSFSEFVDQVAARNVEELEELFTQTFDLNPTCCLEVGWHLFGENYERGRFLVKIRQELSRSQLVESNELPDHLSHILPLLARMEAARAAGLVVDGVLPALEKMIDALKGRDNPYQSFLKTIKTILKESVPVSQEVAHV